MATVVRLSDLCRDMSLDGDCVVADGEPFFAERLWGLALSLAIRDRADSLTYYPWLVNNCFSYVVGAVQYGLVPPPEESVPELLATVYRLIALGSCQTEPRAPLPAAAGCLAPQLQIEGESTVSDWIGVWWSDGMLAGVEFHRLPAVSSD